MKSVSVILYSTFKLKTMMANQVTEVDVRQLFEKGKGVYSVYPEALHAGMLQETPSAKLRQSIRSHEKQRIRYNCLCSG